MIKEDAYKRWEKFKEYFKENPKEFNIFDIMSLRKFENGELFYQMNIFHRLVEFQCAFVSIIVSPEKIVILEKILPYYEALKQLNHIWMNILRKK